MFYEEILKKIASLPMSFVFSTFHNNLMVVLHLEVAN